MDAMVVGLQTHLSTSSTITLLLKLYILTLVLLANVKVKEEVTEFHHTNLHMAAVV
jgi:hypothetical protein